MIDHANLSMAALDLVDPTAAVSEALLLSSSVEEIEVTDPATGDYVGELAASTGPDAEAALRRARGQADEGRWTQMNAEERGDLLTRLVGVLEDKAGALTEIGTLESGTPAQFSSFIHAQAPIDLVRAAQCVPTDAGLDVVAIGWHQPLYFCLRTVADSLSHGRASIVVPSTSAPLSTIALLNCLLEADLPKGIVTALLGTDDVFEVLGPESADTWTDSRPGSSASGSQPIFVGPGADSGELWRSALLAHSIRAGWRPGATHLLVPQDELGDFLAGGTQVLDSLIVGDPWDDSTEVGPIVVGSDPIETYLSGLASGGAEIERGPEPENPGYFVAPAIAAQVDEPTVALDSAVCGPIVALIGYPDAQTADTWVATAYRSS